MSLGLYKKKRKESRVKPGFFEVLTGVKSAKHAAERNMEVPRLKEKVAELEAEKARWEAEKAGWEAEKARWEAVTEVEGKKVDVGVVLEDGRRAKERGRRRLCILRLRRAMVGSEYVYVLLSKCLECAVGRHGCPCLTGPSVSDIFQRARTVLG